MQTPAVGKDSLSLQINLNLNENLKIFMPKFPKYTAFFRKKRKKWENPKGTKQNKQKFIIQYFF